MKRSWALVWCLLPLAASAQDISRAQQVGPKDCIPAIDKPEFITVKQAKEFLADDDMVIGVTSDDGKDARAYPGFILNGHEIVNDVIGGAPISVTW